MEIASLKTVVLVSQQGSFAAAARVLNVDPSSVSRTVTQVETALGLRLFQRTTRSLRLTEEGETYLQRVKPLLEELEMAGDSALASRRKPAGSLRLTASVAFAHECIIPHFGDFQRLYPDIEVELIPTDATLDIVAEGIDLAIRLAPAPQGDLISTRLISTRYFVCASPQYLETHDRLDVPQDLQQHACLRFALPAYRDLWRFRSDAGHSIDVPVSGNIVIANALGLRRAAICGLGPVLLADWLVSQDLHKGTLVRLFPDYECSATTFDTAAWALYPSRSYLPRKVRAMIDFLRQSIRQPQG